MFVSTLLLIMLALAGCSGAKPTAPAPTALAPTVVVPTIAPTTIPTTAPTATSNASAQSADKVLPAAIAKTRAAKIFKAHEEMTFGQVFGASQDNTNLTRLDGEFNDSDAHISVGGTEDNQVTYASLNLVIRNGGCSGSTSLSKSISNTPVVNNALTAKLSTGDGTQITFAGTFGGGQATGTLAATGKLPCDATEIKTTWTAKNASVTTSQPTPMVPVTATKSASSSTSKSNAATNDSISVVDGFFGAINNKNVDTALTFVDDDVIYTFGSPTNSIGKENLKDYLAKLTSSGTTYTLSNYQAIGTIVKFSVGISDGNTYSTSQAMLDNGKIVILTIK